MTEHRYLAASIVTKDLKLWVTGGGYAHDNRNVFLNTTEYIGLDGTVKQGKPFPRVKAFHCMAPVLKANKKAKDIDKTFIIGGYHDWLCLNCGDTVKSTWIFDHRTETYDENLPDMKQIRASLGCATFYSNSHKGRPILIAAGGSTL